MEIAFLGLVETCLLKMPRMPKPLQEVRLHFLENFRFFQIPTVLILDFSILIVSDETDLAHLFLLCLLCLINLYKVFGVSFEYFLY
jgi:hypothetical protein